MSSFTNEPSSRFDFDFGSISVQTHLQNGVMKKRKAGRKKFTETRHPIYRGVRQRCGKWVSELRKPDQKKTRLWLGTFTCPDMAARAYDVAALALKGESADLNFPHEASGLPRIDQSSGCSVKDIQCAALEAAEAFNDSVKSSRKMVYLDEEELFNMPGLIDSMAEGLILTPPAMQKGFNWDGVDLENTVEFSLWSG